MSRRVLLWLSGAAVVLFGGVELVLDGRLQDRGGFGIIDFELAGSSADAQEILAAWGIPGRDLARGSLWLDYPFLVAYGAFTALAAAALGRRAATIAAVLAALCDAVENAFLLAVLGGHERWPPAATAFALAKFALIAFAIVSVVVALAGRLRRRRPA